MPAVRELSRAKEKDMASITLYELLGIPKERADEVARKVRDAFSESDTPGEWIGRLIEEFGVDGNNADIFACGWFAGKYAGVSEVFSVVQKEIDNIEKDRAEKGDTERNDIEKRHFGQDGYA